MMTSLKTRVERAVADSHANVGVAIRHLESGESLYVNADTPVPLASVVKIPVLVEAFRQMGEGRFSMSDRWTVTHDMKALGSGILTELDDNLNPTVKDLLTLMIIVSDNTATDIIMQRLGVEAIGQTMHHLGLEKTHVARTITEIFGDMLPSASPDQDRFALAIWDAKHGVRLDGFAYSVGADNNVSTPREMTRLAELIFTGDLLTPDARAAMLDILLRQQLNQRLSRFLPPGTRVAHKSGTFSGVCNDSGIIYVNDTSHVAVTVLATWDHAAVRGDAIAEWRRVTEIDNAFGMIGLAAYEAFP